MTNPIATISTSRLIAEAISPLDFDELHRLHSDPKVMKTLSADGKPLSEETTREHIRQAVAHWNQHGFGFWVFHRKTDGQFIGRGGLKIYQIDNRDVIGLAYAVFSDYWNQGIATEIGTASLQIGFQQLGMNEIASWTLPNNLASQRVMEKLGFRYESEFDFAGLTHRPYRVMACNWKGDVGGGTPQDVE